MIAPKIQITGIPEAASSEISRTFFKIYGTILRNPFLFLEANHFCHNLEIQRAFLTQAAGDRIHEIATYKIDEANFLVEKNTAYISLVSQDPDALSGVDSARITAFQIAQGQAFQNLIAAIQTKRLRWTVAAASSPAWAKKVFPKLNSNEARVDKLWEEIFKATFSDNNEPVKTWAEHESNLREKTKWLNKEQFNALHYTTPGTDIMIGLPEKHFWEGGGSFAADGYPFMANIPLKRSSLPQIAIVQMALSNARNH